MAGKGGYQPPARPAPASGPGALSRRTDGGPQAKRDLPNAAYGEAAAFNDIQSGAAMAGSPDAGARTAQMARQMPAITPLSEPTQRPDEPVTAGSPSGPGPGPEAIGLMGSQPGQNRMDAQSLASYMPSLERMANTPGAPPSFVRFVRYIRTQGV